MNEKSIHRAQSEDENCDKLLTMVDAADLTRTPLDGERPGTGLELNND